MLPSDINEYKLVIIAPILATIGFVMDEKLDDHDYNVSGLCYWCRLYRTK
ncbi:hypothetical protein MHL86_15365 [Brevibacillus laterosporus]|nr:hypothetical protein [Brevibacillus laterosporus]